jgi:NADH-quinone oxidoreductase subunit J
VAGIYLLLSVEFLALVQVLIYSGAVMVLILFALMLTRTQELKQKLDGDQKPLAAVVALVLAGALVAAITQTDWPRDAGVLTTVSLEQIGDALLGRWAVPFEIASLVLLVALVGAIIISMQEDGRG